MAILTWDDTGTREFETGVSEGVLFLGKNRSWGNGKVNGWKNGVAWNGLINVSHSPSSETNKFYADDMTYGLVGSNEDFSFTIEAYAYPKDFDTCLGSIEIVPGLRISSQEYDRFSLAYKTKIGDDEHPGIDKGYKLHIIYNAIATPSEKQFQTINDSPDAITYSWECQTLTHKLDFSRSSVSSAIRSLNDSAYLMLDSTKVSSTTWNSVNRQILGLTYGFSYLPTPEQILFQYT